MVHAFIRSILTGFILVVRASVRPGETVDINTFLDHVRDYVLPPPIIDVNANRSNNRLLPLCKVTSSSLGKFILTCIHVSMVGHETSAGVVSYTLNELARNQDIQNKLRSELAAAGFSDDSEREPTFDELMDPKLFPYLDAVTKES